MFTKIFAFLWPIIAAGIVYIIMQYLRETNTVALAVGTILFITLSCFVICLIFVKKRNT